jgi:hypothetical protein
LTRTAGWAAGTEAGALRADPEVARTGAVTPVDVPEEPELTEEPDEPVADPELVWLVPELDPLELLVDPLDPPAGVGCGYETVGDCGEGSGEVPPVDPVGLDCGAGPATTPLPDALADAATSRPRRRAVVVSSPSRVRSRSIRLADLAADEI